MRVSLLMRPDFIASKSIYMVIILVSDAGYRFASALDANSVLPVFASITIAAYRSLAATAGTVVEAVEQPVTTARRRVACAALFKAYATLLNAVRTMMTCLYPGFFELRRKGHTAI